MNTLTIKCFGAFRQFGDIITIDTPNNSSVSQVREALVRHIGLEHKPLVEDAVLANDSEILTEAAIIESSTKLSILPPVCGG